MKQTIIDIFLFAFVGFFSEFFIDYVFMENINWFPEFLKIENSSVCIVPTIVIAFFIMSFYKVSIKEHLKNILFLLLFCFFAYTMLDFLPRILYKINMYYVLLPIYTYCALAFLTSLLAYLFRKKNVSCGVKIAENNNKM